jgi:hypothetical protein
VTNRPLVALNRSRLPKKSRMAPAPTVLPIFLHEMDPVSSPMKAKGVAELCICGVAAAVANAIYNATIVRIRDYPMTLGQPTYPALVHSWPPALPFW